MPSGLCQGSPATTLQHGTPLKLCHRSLAMVSMENKRETPWKKGSGFVDVHQCCCYCVLDSLYDSDMGYLK